MTRKPQNRVFQKFASETSFHGFAEAARGKNGSVFALWIFAIAAFFSIFIWETYMICVEFTTTPYVTHISTEPLDILPSIGICRKYTIDVTKVNESGLSNDEVAYLFGYLSGVQGINERNWTEILNNSTLLDRVDDLRNQFPSYAALIQSLSREMSDDLATFTIDCPQCTNAGNITLTPYLKPSGICYKTSPGYLERADKRGLAVPQLQIAHTLHQYETVYSDYTVNYYAGQTAFNEGLDEDSEAADLSSLKIVVETENTNFDDYGDAAVSAVTDGIVLLRRTRFAYKQSTGNCIPDHDLRSDRAGCLRACVNDRHAECGLDCVDYLGEEYEQQTDAVKFCLHFNRTKDQKDCIEHLTTECKEQCPQPCNKIVYDATVLPLMAEHKQTIEQYVVLDAIMGDGSDTLFFKRIILIQPMHPDTLMVVREVTTQTGHTLLANFGGFFGLFLGGSFLSIVHLLYVCACGWLEKPDGGDSGIAGDSDSSLWRKFANETTMHGLDHLAASSRLSAKLFWTLALAVCCSVMWWEMYELGSQFATTPYLTQVEIEPLEDFPLIGLCPDITVDARKVKQQGLTWEDAALVFGTLSKSSVVGLLGVPFNQSRLTQLRSNFATHAELVKSLSIDYTEKISAALNMNGSLHVSNIVKSGGVCFVVQIPPGRSYTEATVDFSNQFAIFFETWKEITEMERWNQKIIYNRTYNPQAGSLNVIDSKIKLMFGTQVTDFAEYGEAVISELIDATVVVQVNRKIKAYEV